MIVQSHTLTLIETHHNTRECTSTSRYETHFTSFSSHLLNMHKQLHYLYTGRVKHNPHPSPNTLGRQISIKLALHNSIASMRPAHTSPIDTEFASVLSGRGCLGDVGDALSEVEGGFFFGVDSLDFDEGGVVVLGAEAAFVAEDGAVDVEAGWLRVLLGHGCVFFVIILFW